MMTKDKLNAASTFDAAKFYDSFGLQLVPIPRENKHKQPKDKDWPEKFFDLKHFVDECNIGGKAGAELGKSKGLFFADVDVDLKTADGKTAWPGASQLVEKLIPASGFIFGRDSAPRMHFGFLVNTTGPTVQYHGLDSQMLIELRLMTHGSRKGKPPRVQQTAIPPGLHYSGETIRFDHLDMVQFAGGVDLTLLRECVQHAALGLAILQVWPDKGLRHHARLAFAKLLQCPELAPLSPSAS